MRFCAINQTLWGLVFFLATVGGAQAGNFSVSPVRATLSAKQSVASLTVHNNSDEPAVIQIELASWAQQAGKEVFTPSREVLATPPLFTLPPGGSQIIRVGLRRTPDQQRELTYRMFLQEVPPSPRAGFQGMQVALRLSIPIFVLPATEAKPSMTWKAIAAENGKVRLFATNTGTAHIQVANVTLSRSGGEEAAFQKVATYILPGESHEWTIPADIPAGQALRLFAKTDGEEIRTEMIVGTP
jgi:fimbrial chaperone protein